jgi:CheY-like chemotaxis protein
MSSRILVIDDDDAINESLCDLLTARGYTVESALNGHEAIVLVNRLGYRADVIVLDLVMPVMDGLEFLRRRVAEPLLANVPVIVMSAQTTRLVQAALKPYAVFAKPPRLDALLDTVSRACQGLPAPAARIA